MTKPRILQIGSLAGSPGADEYLEEKYDVLALWKANDPAQLLKEAQDVQAIVTSAVHGCTRDVIKSLPSLKVICSWGVGYDTIDIEAAHAHGVAVTNTPDVLTDCVADEAWGLLIAAARRIAQGDRYVRANQWESKGKPLPLGTRVSGKRLGIVGLGRIGLAIAKRGLGFDMEVGYHNRKPRTDVPYAYFAELTALAAWSDFLVVATVGGSTTRALVDQAALKALGPNGIIVNIARGPVIDETAMVQCLVSGELGGAGLDVFEKEPTVPEALKTLAHVVLMPHQGSATHETRQAMFELTRQNLDAYFAGKALITPI
jgi:lactate dehydrogenase-like 2-hydroxyacid dehydrogenase